MIVRGVDPACWVGSGGSIFPLLGFHIMLDQTVIQNKESCFDAHDLVRSSAFP